LEYQVRWDRTALERGAASFLAYLAELEARCVVAGMEPAEFAHLVAEGREREAEAWVEEVERAC
jgi:hypothetical protein